MRMRKFTLIKKVNTLYSPYRTFALSFSSCMIEKV